MYNRQKALTFLISMFWIITSIKLFSQTTVTNTGGTNQDVLAMLAVGIPLTIISRINKIPMQVRAQIIVIFTIFLDIIISYQDRRFLLTPMVVAMLAIALTPFYSGRLIVVDAIAGNVMCIAFCVMFPSIAFATVPAAYIIYLIILMNVVAAFSYIIVDWIKKQIKISEDIAVEADNASRAKGEFLATVSHEIRTPMNAIFGMTEIILSAPQNTDVDTLKSNVELIRTSGCELLSLINDILDISRIDQGKMDLQETLYNVSALFRGIKNSAWDKLKGKNITLRTNFDFWISESLLGDDFRIRQICMNIISNAVKYTDEGYIVLNVSQSAISGGVGLLITISDTGIGIKDEELDSIFGDYQAVNANRKMGMDGMGFGLAIAHSLVTLMGGTINVKSVYGSGTTFTVYIPQRISGRQIPDDGYGAAADSLQIPDSVDNAVWIAGVNVQKGIDNCGGTADKFMDALKVFYTSGLSRLEAIRSSFDKKDIRGIALDANWIKTAFGSVDANSLGEMALIIETAAKSGDWETINENIGGLFSEFQRILDETSAIVGCRDQIPSEPVKTLEKSRLAGKLAEVIKASESYMFIDANDIVDGLLEYPFDPEISEKLNEIKTNISLFSRDNTISLAKQLISSIDGNN